MLWSPGNGSSPLAAATGIARVRSITYPFDYDGYGKLP